MAIALARAEAEHELRARRLSPTLVSPSSLAALDALFDEIREVYGFQEESVTVQREHLKRLWSAQAAIAADELIGAAQLHETMFESFERWLDVSAGLFAVVRAQNVFSSYRMPTHPQRLCEMALYLCLWGEAANLRFCPELVCFFFECARKHIPEQSPADDSADAVEGGMADSRAAAGASRGLDKRVSDAVDEEGEGASSENAYLRKYIRPFCAFAATGAPAQPAGPALGGGDSRRRVGGGRRSSIRAPVEGVPSAAEAQGGPAMPPALNYDDWNEVCWTPERIRAIRTRSDDKPVIAYDAHKRWAALSRVDWAKSLSGAPRHVDIRSWACPAASYARIAIYHASSFYAALVFAHLLLARTPWLIPGANAYVYGGLLVPSLLSLCADLARLQFLPAATLLGTLLDVDRSLLTLFQLALYACVLATPSNEALDALFLAVSAISVAKAVLAPKTFRLSGQSGHSADFDSNVLRPSGLRARLALVGFWACVLGAKAVAEGYVLFSTLVESTERLEAIKPLGSFVELRLYAQLADTASRSARVLQQLLLWACAFAVHIATTAHWARLGVVVAGGLRGLHARRGARGPRNLASAACRRPGALSEIPRAAVCQLLPLDGPEGRRERVLRPLAGSGAEMLHPELEWRWAKLWNAICASMRSDDLVSAAELAAVSYELEGTGDGAADDEASSAQGVSSQGGTSVVASMGADWAAGLDGEGGQGAKAGSALNLISGGTSTPLGPYGTPSSNGVPDLSSKRSRDKLRAAQQPRVLSRPKLFEPRTRREMLRLERPQLPRSAEFRRRLDFFAHSLRMDMPTPVPVERMPSFTVLIAHSHEPVLTSTDSLFARKPRSVAASAAGTQRSATEAAVLLAAAESEDQPAPLIALLMEYFPDELCRLHERIGDAAWTSLWDSVASSLDERGEVHAAMLARRESGSGVGFLNGSAPIKIAPNMRLRVTSDPSNWHRPPSSAAVNKSAVAARRGALLLPLRKWASVRLQTLYRTVRGMMQYERALHLLLEVQAPHLSRARCDEIVRGKFQCLVSMQRYVSFDEDELEAAEELLREFPSLNIAYLDVVPEPRVAGGLRHFSCLIDGSCPVGPGGRRVPRARVELPGDPILGDGKGDNQNHAIPYVQGRLLQTIDANQDGYLEEALKICNALAEFGTDPTGTRDRISIAGFREHIYSSLGTVASFVASSEFVFGTLLQRTMDQPLFTRQHCARVQ
jgi:hypothetical protein